MHKSIVVLTFVLITLQSHAADFLKGVSLQAWDWNPEISYGTDASLRTIQKAAHNGIDTVGVRQYLKVETFDSAHVSESYPGQRTETAFLDQIRQNRAQGLKTFFTLGMEVIDKELGIPNDDSFFAWHGAIDLGTPTEVDQWFSDYTALALKYARIANEERVSVFSLGNELVSMSTTAPIKDLPGNLDWLYGYPHPPRFDKYARICLDHLISFKAATASEPQDKQRVQETLQFFNTARGAQMPNHVRAFLVAAENARRTYLEKKWREMIATVRPVYTANFPEARLTMNANHDHFKYVTFWDALDVTSISTYYGLTPQSGKTPDAGPTDVNTLAQGWERVIKIINEFRKTLPVESRRPILFSELGFTDRKYSAAIPWAGSGTYSLRFSDGVTRPIDFANRPADPSERANALLALDQVRRKGHLPWLTGIILWNAYPDGRSRLDDYALFTDEQDPTDGAVSVLFQ